MQDQRTTRLSRGGYSTRKILVPLFVLLYTLVAVWGDRASPRGEWFPVFNWSLFTYVSDERTSVEIYVLRIGDRVFKRPVNYFELDEYFPSAQRRSTDVRKTLERLLRAVRRGDEAQMASLRKVLETRHLSGRGRVLYEVRTVTFRPLQRWRTGKVISHELLARIETEGTP